MQLVTACSYPVPASATPPRDNLDSARSGLAKMALASVYAAVLNFAGGLYGETFIFLTPTPGPGRPGGTLRPTHTKAQTSLYLLLDNSETQMSTLTPGSSMYEAPLAALGLDYGRFWDLGLRGH